MQTLHWLIALSVVYSTACSGVSQSVEVQGGDSAPIKSARVCKMTLPDGSKVDGVEITVDASKSWEISSERLKFPEKVGPVHPVPAKFRLEAYSVIPAGLKRMSLVPEFKLSGGPFKESTPCDKYFVIARRVKDGAWMSVPVVGEPNLGEGENKGTFCNTMFADTVGKVRLHFAPKK